MSTQVVFGPYRGFAMNLDPIRPPNPGCCNDVTLLCPQCAALALKQAGVVANEADGEDPDDDDEAEDGGWEEVEDDFDDFDDDEDDEDEEEPFDDEEDSEMSHNTRHGLTYVGMPSEMEAIAATEGTTVQNATGRTCRESKKPTANTRKYSPSGIPLTFVGGCPSEYIG